MVEYNRYLYKRTDDVDSRFQLSIYNSKNFVTFKRICEDKSLNPSIVLNNFIDQIITGEDKKEAKEPMILTKKEKWEEYLKDHDKNFLQQVADQAWRIHVIDRGMVYHPMYRKKDVYIDYISLAREAQGFREVF